MIDIILEQKNIFELFLNKGISNIRTNCQIYTRHTHNQFHLVSQSTIDCGMWKLFIIAKATTTKRQGKKQQLTKEIYTGIRNKIEHQLTPSSFVRSIYLYLQLMSSASHLKMCNCFSFWYGFAVMVGVTSKVKSMRRIIHIHVVARIEWQREKESK